MRACGLCVLLRTSEEPGIVSNPREILPNHPRIRGGLPNESIHDANGFRFGNRFVEMRVGLFHYIDSHRGQPGDTSLEEQSTA